MRSSRFLFAGMLALACCGKHSLGELMLAIDTDLRPGGDKPDFDAFQINVTNDGFSTRPFTEFGAQGLPLTFPATFALVSNGDPNLSLHLRIYAGLMMGGTGMTSVGDPRVLRELVSAVPTDRIALLRLRLEWSCVGNAYDKGGTLHYVESNCDEGTTCIAGSCTPWDVDAKTLPDFDRTQLFGTGACFDTVACLAGGSTVALDASSCAFPRPSSVGARFNVGIITSDGLGICGADGTCYVPLDADSDDGWRDTGSTIQLPAGYCHPAKGVQPGRIRGVVISTACGSKPETLPTCGPWSAVGDGGTFDVRGPLASDAGALGADP
jgi:hypothetical protein